MRFKFEQSVTLTISTQPRPGNGMPPDERDTGSEGEHSASSGEDSKRVITVVMMVTRVLSGWQ